MANIHHHRIANLFQCCQGPYTVPHIFLHTPCIHARGAKHHVMSLVVLFLVYGSCSSLMVLLFVCVCRFLRGSGSDEPVWKPVFNLGSPPLQFLVRKSTYFLRRKIIMRTMGVFVSCSVARDTPHLQISENRLKISLIITADFPTALTTHLAPRIRGDLFFVELAPNTPAWSAISGDLGITWNGLYK